MFLKILKWFLIGLAVVLVALFAAAYISDPVLTTRLLTLNQGPEEVVSGTSAAELPVSAHDKSQIQTSAIESALAYGEETGSAALIIYKDGAIELEHYYGDTDVWTITPTQSMHKSVLAMLVGIAIRDGFIKSVDEPAATWLTEWANDDRNRITIRQMLQQTSGIDFDSFSLNLGSGFFQLMMGDDIRPYALGNGILFPPDTEFDYNSVNPQLLGIVIERATGKRYAEYLSDALWRHLDVSDAAVVLDSENGMARTFCCLQATARSWLQIGILHLNDGRWDEKQVVPAEWMRKIRTPGAIQPNYGLLTWLGTEWSEYRYYNRKTSTRVLHSEPFAAADVVYFDGMGGQRVYIIPSEKMVIVRTGDITMDWDDSRLPNLILRGLIPESG